MKYAVSCFIALLFALTTLQAQENMFDSGDKVISVGIGIGNTLFDAGTAYSTLVPPISISYEQAILDDITDKGVLGLIASMGYTSYKLRYSTDSRDFGWNYNNYILGTGALFHYPLLHRLDSYAGAMVAYNFTVIAEYGDTGDNIADAAGGLLFAAFIGGRYYFTNQFAAFAQLGYGVAYLTLGVSIRL